MEATATILVVDDEPANLSVATGILSPEFSVRAVTSGAQAITQVREHQPPDMILLDLMMPGMDGFEVLRTLKADPLTASIPVIIVSGLSEEVDEERGLELGAEDYVTKPIRPLVLRARVRTHLAIQRARLNLAEQNRWLEEEVRIRTEEALRIREAQEKNYRSLFQTMLTGFATHEISQGEGNAPPAYAILDVNTALEELLGCREDQLIGHGITETFPFIDEQTRNRYDTVASTGEPSAFDYHLPISDRYWEVTVFRISDRRLATVIQDVTARTQAFKDLEVAYREKAALLREVHHRVRNNLSVVSGLIGFQLSQLTDPAGALEAFRNTRDRIAEMACVHDELYQSRDYGCIDLAQYIPDLFRRIITEYNQTGEFTVETTVASVCVGVDIAVPFGLVLNEVITNSVKHCHAKDDRNKITLNLVIANDHYIEVEIFDNGPGLPPDIRDGSSVGVTLIRMLSEQIGGDLSVRDGEGTGYHLRFPIGTETHT